MTRTKLLGAAAATALVVAFVFPASAQEDAAQVTTTTQPPVAEKREHSYSHHGITISDPYNWLHDKSYPTVDDEDVLDYLKAENAYFEAQMAPHQALKDTIFEELKARVKQDDSTVPQKDGDWLYWSEVAEGKEYRIHYRKPVAGGETQLLIDENALAEGKEYFRLGAASVSDNGRYIAYSYDDNGSERFTARIKEIATGELLDDVIPETLSGLTWLANDTMIAYGKANENWRVDNVRLHKIGTPVEQDVEIYREEDEGFRVGAGLSAQEDWLVISTGDNETSEVRLVRADDPTGEQILVKPRAKGVEYDVDVRDGTVFVHTNDDHVNFRLATAPLQTPGEWTTLIPGSDDFYLTGYELYKGFYVTEGRLDGLDQIQLRDYADASKITLIAFPEASFSTGLSNNPEYDVQKLRLAYESMITPDSVYDYDVATGELELLKQQEIPSGYTQGDYVTERLTITARDGTKPVSVVGHKDSRWARRCISMPTALTAMPCRRAFPPAA